MILVAFVVGAAFFVAAWFHDITPDDLTKVAGTVSQLELKTYLDERCLYWRIDGTAGRFKYSEEFPNFDAVQASIREGTPLRLWAETSSLDAGFPAKVFQAEVDGKTVVRFADTKPIYDQERWHVVIFAAFCWLAGLAVWRRAARQQALPAPADAEDDNADDVALPLVAQRHWLLLAVVHIVVTIGRWFENIPFFGELAIAFFYFWIMPLYMVYIYVIARSRRWLVVPYCVSYWVLFAVSMVAAAIVPDFPGGSEYPELGPTGSRLTAFYIHLNLAYGGMLLLWAILLAPQPAHEPS